ncbi:DUF2304 domain-containing protein [uncultured Actinomyces sp.]|uniref:DUF2304 domain-containing protein n=1 Tax=uncultured Actinomyces sp. TaxID=249061 RepID=UPI00288BE5A6|nr:DUF2304 domain-containing protein [uncultured Actinomyces sp.]
MIAQVFFIVIALVIILFVISLLRSRRLREKYAALWILVGTTVLILALAPALLQMLAHLLGFQVPSNFLFLLAILLLLGVSLHLSLEISRLEDETRVLAEHVAILDLMLSKLSPPSDRASGEEPPSARREP